MLLSLFFIKLFVVFTIVEAHTVLDLSRTNWRVISANKSIDVPAKVPGSIYSDLRTNKVLKEDIYHDRNDINYRWVAWDNWTYISKFDVTDELVNNMAVYLVAHGLDTIANVSLNGQLLGSVDNQYVRYRWLVKELLKTKDNQLVIAFTSAPAEARRRHNEWLHTKKYPLPPVSLPKIQHGEDLVQLIRKMPSSFSSDWGPAFPTQGIWKPIELIGINQPLIRDINVDTKPFEHGWFVNTTIWLEDVPEANFTSVLFMIELENCLQEQVIIEHVQFDKNGEASVAIQFSIPQAIAIKPWWPNGLGEQNLYNLTIKSIIENKTESKTIRVGFRTIHLVQDRLLNTPETYSFYFNVNGNKMYAKGSTWIPAHLLQEAITNDYVEHLLLSARLANMNMLRVWGGGVYESDYFYKLCDRYGLLIWQDMMFVNALYPTNSKFLESVATEVSQQVRRLQYHPSIAIWSGNNGNENSLAQSYLAEVSSHQQAYINDYHQLYIEIIRPLMLNIDKSRPWVASSPSIGRLDEHNRWINSQNNLYGDVHFYINHDADVWSWKVYPSSKFVSEYGFQSVPFNMANYLPANQLKYPLSEDVEHRQHLGGGNELMTKFLEKYLPLPLNGTRARYDDYVYLTQVFQTMAMKTETELYRRNRHINKDGTGNTMGALYLQLNDAWPGYSRSSIEFGGRWKLLHSYMRTIFANFLVMAFEDNADGEALVKVAVVNDLDKDINVDVKLSMYSYHKPDQAFHELYYTRHVSSFSVLEAAHEKRNFILQGRDANETFIRVSAHNTATNQTVENFLFLQPTNFANLGSGGGVLPRANVSIGNVIKSTSADEFGLWDYTIELTTDQIAFFVMFQTDHVGVFTDNGFVLIHEKYQPYPKFHFLSKENIETEELKRSIHIKTLTDVNVEF